MQSVRPVWWLAWLLGVAFPSLAQMGAPPADVERVRAMMVPASSYPNAAAVFLLDRKSLEVGEEGRLRISVRQTIQILNERGQRYAQVQIPFNRSYQKLSGYWARTLQPDGSVRLVPADTFAEARLGSNYPLYADVGALTFSMPAAGPGAILDYEVTVDTERGIFSSSFSDFFLLQAADPIRLSKYALTVPKAMSFQVVYGNTELTPQIEESTNATTYLWQQVNVPAVPLEPNMPPFQDVAAWMMVTNIAAWDDVAAWYSDLARPQYQQNATLRQETEDILKGAGSREEKLQRLFYYVQSKIRYVAIDLGRSAYQPHPATEVLEKQYGDCKDQATLLIAMLKVAGIEAYPALVRRRNAGRLARGAPTPQQFDHVVVVVPRQPNQTTLQPDTVYWLDPTVETAPFAYLPANLQGCEAMVVKDRRAVFLTIPFPPPESNLRRRRAWVQMERDGSIWVDAELEEQGAFSQRTRSAFLTLAPARFREEIEAGVNQTCPFARVYEEPEFSDLRAAGEPLRIRFRFRVPEYADLSVRSLAFRASLLERLNSRVLLPDTRRLHPFVFPEPLTTENQVEVTPPPNYTVAEMPLDVDLDYPFGRLLVTYRQQGQKIVYTRRLALRPYSVPPELYDTVREFYERVWYEDNKRPIVLRRP